MASFVSLQTSTGQSASASLEQSAPVLPTPDAMHENAQTAETIFNAGTTPSLGINDLMEPTALHDTATRSVEELTMDRLDLLETLSRRIRDLVEPTYTLTNTLTRSVEVLTMRTQRLLIALKFGMLNFNGG